MSEKKVFDGKDWPPEETLILVWPATFTIHSRMLLLERKGPRYFYPGERIPVPLPENHRWALAADVIEAGIAALQEKEKENIT